MCVCVCVCVRSLQAKGDQNQQFAHWQKIEEKDQMKAFFEKLSDSVRFPWFI